MLRNGPSPNSVRCASHLRRLRILALAAMAFARSGAAEAPPAAGEFTMQPANETPIQMPAFTVTVSHYRGGPVYRLEQFLDRLMPSPFLNLRSGALIEAIVWRHRYLKEHPGEQAVIFTDERDGRVISATTAFSRDGRLYVSSQVLGAETRLEGFTAEDLRTPEKVHREIEARRGVYLGYIATDEDRKNIMRGPTQGVHDASALMAAAMRGSSSSTFVQDADSGVWDTLGARIAYAEETGDYSHIIPGIPTPNIGFGSEELPTSTFNGSAQEVLLRTYEALHDPEQAGFIPVAQATLEVPDNRGRQGRTVPWDVVVFDWEGRHYIYHPDSGTYAQTIPVNPLTGQPYLCIPHGDLLESIVFCAVYPKAHPGERAVLLAPPGGPYAAAFTKGAELHLFSPYLGRTLIPPRLKLRLDDVPGLVRLHALLVERERRRLAATKVAVNPNSVPASLAGDNADMQMRRAFLGLWSAGIVPRLVPRADAAGHPLLPVRQMLTCQWEGATYAYAFDGPLSTTITVGSLPPK